MCQVIFKAIGITSAMVPKEASEKIPNLLISTAENGVSTHETFLAAMQEFDEYLEEKQIERPVVLLSDGHSSRLEYDVLAYLQSRKINLFISPPDTTGVTQLLDQLNKNIHQEYEKEKASMFTEFNSLNREAFMLILANIWDRWATKERLINAARRVGITNDTLSVEFMQQDKFKRAEECMEPEVSTPSTSASEPMDTPGSDSIKSPNKRRGSASYWRDKFQQAIGIIDELHEKSITLTEIPGFMTVQKVKPKLSKENVRVTQIHGSMKAKNVINVVKEIKEKKEQTAKQKQETIEKKEETKQRFLLCKLKCVCKNQKCDAVGYKQCPVCLQVMKSVCSKSRCKVDGMKPSMILPAAITAKEPKKCLFPIEENDSDSEESDYSDDSSEDDDAIEDDDDDDTMEYEDLGPKRMLKKTWESLSPPNKEEDLVGKWYGVIYESKRCSMLFVGKILRRFLHDEEGPVDSVEIRCMKPKIGSGTILEDTPAHCPDVSTFQLTDVIFGPLNVVPLKGNKFDVPEYEKVVEHFNIVKNIERKDNF